MAQGIRASEIELHGGKSCDIDSLLLNQSQQLLFTHLRRRYSDLSARGLNELDHSAPPHALRRHLLKRVTNFVQQNLAVDIRLADLAGLVHLSERHFIRAFRAATGVTPYRYVLEQRPRVAAGMLRMKDDRSIVDIARSTGFKNQSHFTAEIKGRYGTTPTCYRRISDAD